MSWESRHRLKSRMRARGMTSARAQCQGLVPGPRARALGQGLTLRRPLLSLRWPIDTIDAWSEPRGSLRLLQ